MNEEKALKLAKWREIQERAPDLAEFLKKLNAAFGKVSLKSVEFK